MSDYGRLLQPIEVASARSQTNGIGYYVYVYLDPLRDMVPFYVGCGVGDRAFHHLRLGSGHNRRKTATIAKIIRETGANPPIAIHAEGLSLEESRQIEIELIAKYGRRGDGSGSLTNLTAGGEGAANPCEETRRAMSRAKVGTIAAITSDGHRMRVTPDDPRWVSGELVGQTRGKTTSAYQRLRSSLTHKGKRQTPEHVAKVVAALRGKKKTASHLAALSAVRRGLIFVRSKDGGPAFKVQRDDPRLLTGEVVGVTSGRRWVHDPVSGRHKVILGPTPDGFIDGRRL